MSKISGFVLAGCVVVALVRSGISYLEAEEKQQVNISLQGVQDGIDRTPAVKAGFSQLSKLCTAIVEAKDLVVTHEQGDLLVWRNEKLGWQSDYYFKAVDRSGETHHFYLRDDGKNELIINAKQASLDWCGIKQKMDGYYLTTF